MVKRIAIVCIQLYITSALAGHPLAAWLQNQEPASTVWTPPEYQDTVAWYKFDADSWPMTDYSALGTNSGTQADASRRPTITVGYAYFDGTNDIFNTATTGVLHGATCVTVMAWVWVARTNQASSQEVIAQGNAGGAQFSYWRIFSPSIVPDQSQSFRALHMSTSGSTPFGTTRTGTWVHCAITWCGTAAQQKTYTNGVLVSTLSRTGGTYVEGDPTRPYWFLGGNGASNSYFQGRIDGFLMYRNRELTSNQVHSVATRGVQ